MTDTVTHLLISWILAVHLVGRPGQRLLVVLSGIFMDADVFFDHHGFVHTPFFALIVFLALFFSGKFGNRTSVSCLAAMLSHIFLDYLATRDPVMLFYPLSHEPNSLGILLSDSGFIALKFLLLFFALSYTIVLWTKGTKISELPDWLTKKIGRPAAYAVYALLVCIIAFEIYRYFLKGHL